MFSGLALDKLARAIAEKSFPHQGLRESNLLHAQSLQGCPPNWGRQQTSEQQDQTSLCRINLVTDNAAVSSVIWEWDWPTYTRGEYLPAALINDIHEHS